MKKYNKLVRDKIPDIIKSEGLDPDFVRLKKVEYKDSLIAKLKEEVDELYKSNSKKERVEELSDIQEVLTAIYKVFGIECSEVTKLAREKRKKKGSFEKQIFLKSVK